VPREAGADAALQLDHVDSVAEWLGQRTSRGRLIVGIDGPSGSGKSTFAGGLADRLGGVVVEMDSIYPGWDGLADAPRRLVDHLLDPLAAGRAPMLARWNWDDNTESTWIDLTEVLGHRRPLVIEGVGAGAEIVRPHLDALVWIEAPDALRRERALGRDGDVYRPHWERWAEQELRFFNTERPADAADVMIRLDVTGVATLESLR
jgi:hypothetical protein